jgi:succinoglycan biosynthesis transport protein ExoP
MGSTKTQLPPGAGIPENYQTGFSTTVSDTTLSEALITLRKRRWVLVASVLLGLAYGIYKAESQPQLFEAYGRIQVRAGSSNEYRVGALPGYGGDTSSKMLSEIEILKSDTLMLKVAREMDLSNNATFLETKGPVPHTSVDTPNIRQSTVHVLQSNLHVALVPKTDIIRISYSSLSPKLSADIVNKVISTYIQRSYETRFDSSQRVSKWLSSTLDDLKQQVETSQEQMMDMERRLGILGFDPTHNQISTSLDDLSRAAGSAKLARIIAESRYRILNGMDPNSIEGSIETTPGTAPGELSGLRAQLATARASFAQLEATLGPNHPQSKAAKAQIDELTKEIDTEQNRLLLQAKENYVIARANEDQTTAALEAQKTDAYKLRDDLVEYTLRKREFEANRTLYDSLRERLRTAGVQAGLESLEIDVVDQALPPANPVLKPQSTIILTSLVFGLLGGIVVAFLLESLDTGMRSIAEIESITELPSLASEYSHNSAAQYWRVDAAEVAVYRSVPLTAYVAAPVDHGTPAEDHCSDQRNSIRRKDDGCEQSGCDPGAAGHARFAARRRSSSAKRASPIWNDRQDWPDDCSDRSNDAGRDSAGCARDSESRYPSQRTDSAVSRGDVELRRDGFAAETVQGYLQLRGHRFSTDSVGDGRCNSFTPSGRSCAGRAPW